jgi:PhnB protein
MRIRVHLSFDGRCEEAFRAYQRILGGELVTMLKYGESPMAADSPIEMHDKILHATLKIADQELLGADVAPGDFERPQGFSVVLDLLEPAEGKRVFGALAEGGSVRMPFQETFWSPGYGMLVDRFGVPWEINCE